jgi:hypothetical protein
MAKFVILSLLLLSGCAIKRKVNAYQVRATAACEKKHSVEACRPLALPIVYSGRRLSMNWKLSDRADREALPIADRHYNRQKIGSPQFVPPGRCLVLLCVSGAALWVTSWPFAEYVRHAWPGAWINSAFRRESGPVASELIREAIAVQRAGTGPKFLRSG